MGASTYQFEIEEKDEMDTLHKAIVLTNPRKRCQCGDVSYENKYFTSNKDKEGNTYINVKCSKCSAKSKLGRYKAGGYFWHEYEIYKPEKKETESEKTELKENVNPNDIPF
jgi:hypothetical protein